MNLHRIQNSELVDEISSEYDKGSLVDSFLLFLLQPVDTAAVLLLLIIKMAPLLVAEIE